MHNSRTQRRSSLDSAAAYTSLRSRGEASLAVARASCTWEDVPPPGNLMKFELLRGGRHSPVASTHAELQRCEVPATADAEGYEGTPATWSFLRLGPVSTSGNGQWAEVSELRMLEALCLPLYSEIVQFVAAIREPGTGRILTMPKDSIKLHHLNTHSVYSLSEDLRPWGVQWTGKQGDDALAKAGLRAGGAYLGTADWECGDVPGRDKLDEATMAACTSGAYHHRLVPAPFAYVARPSLFEEEAIDAIVKDARPADSAPLSWYLEFALLRLRHPTVRHRAPAMHAIKPVFGLLEATIEEEYGNYHLPALYGSLNWLHFNWPVGCEVLEQRTHTHTKADATWLVAGTPEDLDLPSLELEARTLTVTYPSAGLANVSWHADRSPQLSGYFRHAMPVARGLSDAKARMYAALERAHARSPRPRLLCTFDVLSTADERTVFNIADHLACERQHLRFAAGEPFTLVAFNTAPPDPLKAPMQHSLWAPWLGLTGATRFDFGVAPPLLGLMYNATLSKHLAQMIANPCSTVG